MSKKWIPAHSAIAQGRHCAGMTKTGIRNRNYLHIMLIPIAYRYKRTKAPAITVVIIARDLRLSRTIPTMPNTKAKGNVSTISNPPRIARGLPHPGRRTAEAKIVTIEILSRIADILP